MQGGLTIGSIRFSQTPLIGSFALEISIESGFKLIRVLILIHPAQGVGVGARSFARQVVVNTVEVMFVEKVSPRSQPFKGWAVDVHQRLFVGEIQEGG